MRFSAFKALVFLGRGTTPKQVDKQQNTVELYRLLSRDDHWAALATIVDNLVAHETLEGDEVENIVEQWLR